MSDTGNLILKNILLVDAESLTADFTSLPQDISSTRSYSVQAVWQGATGASSADLFVLEAGLDQTNFTEVTSTALDATAGSILINVEYPSYPYIRVRFDKQDASAGTMSVRLAEKI